MSPYRVLATNTKDDSSPRHQRTIRKIASDEVLEVIRIPDGSGGHEINDCVSCNHGYTQVMIGTPSISSRHVGITTDLYQNCILSLLGSRFPFS